MYGAVFVVCWWFVFVLVLTLAGYIRLASFLWGLGSGILASFVFVVAMALMEVKREEGGEGEMNEQVSQSEDERR